jgi:acyl carrier protein
MSKKIEDEIKSLISKIFNITVKKISSSTTSKDIPKWDSIGQIRLILLIESKYKIKINQKMYDKLLSLDKIVKYLKKHNK